MPASLLTGPVKAQASGQLSGSATPSYQYIGAITVGDLLVNCLNTTQAVTPNAPPTDTIGTVYTLITTVQNGVTVLWVYAGIAPAAAAANTNTVQYAISAVGNVSICLVDAPGYILTLDGTPVPVTGTGVLNPIVGPITTTNPASLLISFIRTLAVPITAGGTGWTFYAGGGSALQFLVSNGAGTYNANFTSTGAATYASVILGFLPKNVVTVQTQPATNLGPQGAQLNGTLASLGPGGNATVLGFNYGLTAAYGTTVQISGSFPTGGFYQILSTLLPNTNYHFQAFAITPDGTFYGVDQTFATTPQGLTVNTGAAILQSPLVVQLNGAIIQLGNSLSPATLIGFNYGLTTAYGSQISTAGSFPVGNFTEILTNLQPGTTYHYQAYATSPDGTAVGVDQTFTTRSVPVGQVTVAREVHIPFSGQQGQITFDTLPGPGNGIQLDIFWLGTASIITQGVSDNQLIGANPANTWTMRNLQTNGFANPNQFSQWVTNRIIGGSAPITITVNFSAPVTEGFLVAREVTGQFQGLDWNSTKFAGYGAANPTTLPVVNVSPAIAGELLITAVFTSTPTTLTPSLGWIGPSTANGQGSFTFFNPSVNNYNAQPCQMAASGPVQIQCTAWVPLAPIAPVLKSQSYLRNRNSGKRILRGIVETTPGTHTTPVLPIPIDQIEARPGWSFPGSNGILYREFWSSIEPQQGVYDPSRLDYILNVLCPKYNKAIGLIVQPGTQGTPSWLTGAEMLNMSSGSFPAPWDPVYQTQWGNAISYLGNRYDKNPYLGYIDDIGCGYGGQADLCLSTGDNTLFYNGDAFGGSQAAAIAGWVQATTQITQLWINAFPNTPLGWSLGPIIWPNNYQPFWLSTALNFKKNGLAPRNNGIHAGLALCATLLAVPTAYGRWGAKEAFWQEGKADVGYTNFMAEIALCRACTMKGFEVYPSVLNLDLSTIGNVQRLSAEMNQHNWGDITATAPWIHF